MQAKITSPETDSNTGNIPKTNLNLPPLKPITSGWMRPLLTDFKLQEQLLQRWHSPLNIHHLGAFQENCREYLEILNTYNFKSRLFFARKANKFKNLIPAAVEAGAGIDTASYRELEQCLQLGIAPHQLISTAAIKEERLLKLAIDNGVLLVIDNTDELQNVLRVAQSLGKPAPIGIRISGFRYKGEKLYSRFGFDIDEVATILQDFFDASETGSHISLRGFHFHLDGYSTAQRGTALHQTLDLINTLNLKTEDDLFIDMGGGILMNYLQSEQEWIRFQDILKQAVCGEHPPITFGNEGLGFEFRDENVEGRLDTYPYYNEYSKVSFLKEILQTTNDSAQTVALRLETEQIELRLEPGRSLLNQVGVSLARVVHRKKDARGDYLIGLEMNMSQLKSSSADFLLDPFASFKNPDPDAEPVGVYFTGAYCLERDVLLKRKIELPQLPEPGDTICFVNTAGYMMHFFETEAHLFDRAGNLALDADADVYRPEDFSTEL